MLRIDHIYTHSATSASAASTANIGREICSVCGGSFPDLAALISHCEVAHQEGPPPQPATVPVVMGTIVPETQHGAPGAFESWSRLCSGIATIHREYFFLLIAKLSFWDRKKILGGG